MTHQKLIFKGWLKEKFQSCCHGKKKKQGTSFLSVSEYWITSDLKSKNHVIYVLPLESH